MDGGTRPDYFTTVLGGAGSDTIINGVGDGLLDGGAGQDMLIGGGAAGSASGGHGQGDSIIGVDELIGSAFGTSLTGYYETHGRGLSNIIDGGAGNDIIAGFGGDDRLPSALTAT